MKSIVKAAAALLVAGLTTGAAQAAVPSSCGGLDITAHRGAAPYPENSLSSIRAAGALGFRTAEVDVQMLRDGTWVLHHDIVAGRVVKGTIKPVNMLDPGDWRRLELADRHGRRSSERPAFLADALETARDAGIGLNVEIKGKFACRHITRLVHQVQEALPASLVSFTSVDPQALPCVRAADPGAYVGLVTAPDKAALEEKHQGLKTLGGMLGKKLGVDVDAVAQRVTDAYARIDNSAFLTPDGLARLAGVLGEGPKGVHVDVMALTPAIARSARDEGLMLYTYGSMGDAAHAARLREMGVRPDGVILDGSPEAFCRNL